MQGAAQRQDQVGSTVSFNPSRIPTAVIVDDDEQVLSLLSRWMTKAGMRVTICRTFGEAVHELATEVPRVLVTDIRLNGFNGLGLIARTKQRHPGVSTVVLTGFDDPVLRREADGLKTQFLVKPVRREELLAALSTESDQPDTRKQEKEKEKPKGDRALRLHDIVSLRRPRHSRTTD